MAPPAAAKGREIGTPVKLLLGLVGLVAAAGLYYFFFYTDLSNALRAATDRKGQLQNEQRSAAAAYKAYLDDATKLEEKRARARDLNRQLPETNEMASFLTAINQQAEIAGLKVRLVNPIDPQPQQFYTRVPVKLEVVGRFHQVARFFYGVSKLDRIINVENINLGKPVNPNPTADEGESIITTSCLTTTFHANKAPTPGAPGAPGAPPPPGAPPTPPPPPPGAPK